MDAVHYTVEYNNSVKLVKVQFKVTP